jgi:peptide/nickel transport system ATP-binding protein
MDGEVLLTVEDLCVSFTSDAGSVQVVDTVSFRVPAGRTISLVGESGCGKTVTASSVMRLLPHPYGQITAGRVLFEEENLLELPVEQMYRIRGGKISMIFQEPMNALNPVQTAGNQIREVLNLHRPELDGKAAEEEMIRLLRQVEMPSPRRRLRNFPFQLSGGMRQRMMIAMALAGLPRLLIADEPTTALDVTVQAQILNLIRELQTQTGMGVLFITHDMGVVAEVSDDVYVMYAGQIVESSSVQEIFGNPLHPYTRGLIGSMPNLGSEPKSQLPAIAGSVPAPSAYPATCRFANRCRYATEWCRSETPVLEEVQPGHTVRCLRVGEIS